MINQRQNPGDRPFLRFDPLFKRQLAVLSALLLMIPLAESPRSVVGGEPEGQRPRFLLEWGHRGKGPGEFDFPIGIAIGRDGAILITDFYNARVQQFSPDGKFLSSFSVLPNPGGIALDRADNVYLAHFSAMRQNEERKPDRISVYSRKGEF